MLTSPSLGCAVSADGNLLDASQIKWYNDADDEMPLPTPALVMTEKAPIHPLFQSSSIPGIKVAGSRCSNRATRPSARAIDPDNAEALASTTGKRVRKAPVLSCRISRKVVESDHQTSQSDSGSHGSLTEQDQDGEGTDHIEDFNRLQMMADTDHAVCVPIIFVTSNSTIDFQALNSCSKSDRTADVRTIFRQDKEHKNESGAPQPGHWCKICECVLHPLPLALELTATQGGWCWAKSQLLHRRDIDLENTYCTVCSSLSSQP